MTIKTWLTTADTRMKESGIPSPTLDARLLLAYTLKRERSWLLAHGDEALSTDQLEAAQSALERRLKREPIAYITGHKEFYGRDFTVTPDTLIPRPESEVLVEVAKSYNFTGRLLDVGTGSGCLGITLKLELPDCNVVLSDTSKPALNIARHNAETLGANITCVQSDLLDHWLTHDTPLFFDVIIANLPYVDRSWGDVSPEISHEPASALFADDGGLALIIKLIDQSPTVLNTGGYLLLEADPTQHEAIIKAAQPHFTVVEQRDYALLLQMH